MSSLDEHFPSQMSNKMRVEHQSDTVCRFRGCIFHCTVGRNVSRIPLACTFDFDGFFGTFFLPFWWGDETSFFVGMIYSDNKQFRVWTV